jgi:phosphoglycerate kinase
MHRIAAIRRQLLAPHAQAFRTTQRFLSTAQIKSSKRGVEGLGEKDLKGKNVFVRVDFNVPQDKKSGKITDDTRIRASLPTIEYLKKRGARVILCSHLGRPDGKVSDKYRLAPVGVRLAELLKQPVQQCTDSIGKEVSSKVANLKDGGILLLENVRFHDGEEKNDPKFAQSLAESTNANVYVNDAFGTAHRAHASTAGICKYIKGPSVAGFLMEKELKYLTGAIENPAPPFAALIGGAKVSTKIPVLNSLLAKTDKLLIGGAMAFTFLKARGLSVGTSLVEDKFLATARDLEKQADARGVELYLPTDVVIAREMKEDAEFKVVPVNQIPDGWMGVDIGPNSRADIANILRQCKTILWNGPVGVFEMKNFAEGTLSIAKVLAEVTKAGAVTIVGGGDSVAAAEEAGVADQLSHVSTGGGASLEMLEGKVLPGVAALNDA